VPRSVRGDRTGGRQDRRFSEGNVGEAAGEREKLFQEGRGSLKKTGV